MMGNFGLAAVGSAGPVPTLLLAEKQDNECYAFSIIRNVNLFLRLAVC